MKLNRWVYAFAGVVTLLLAGLVYAWSVLSMPLAAYFTEWTKAQMSLTFTICMMFFCFGCMAGGMTAGKLNVKIHVRLSGALFFAGFFIAGRANSPAVLYLGYGALCGFASGFVYNAVLSTMSGWFPDKQGLISGILLMGFGISSFLVGKIYQAVTPSGEGVEAWRDSFFWFGVILAAVLFVCGCFFVRPDKESLAAMGVLAEDKKQGAEDEPSIDTKAMVRRPSFWLFFCWTIAMGGAGMALISQAGGIAKEAGPEQAAGTIATVVGLISIFNGLGRVFFGNLFDKRGRRVTMMAVGIGFGLSAAVLAAALGLKAFFLVVLGFGCCGFFYGGLNPSISAFVNASYGPTHYPVNFSVMNLNLLMASFGGTIAGMLFDASGSYMSTCLFMIGGGLVSLVFAGMIRKV